MDVVVGENHSNSNDDNDYNMNPRDDNNKINNMNNNANVIMSNFMNLEANHNNNVTTTTSIPRSDSNNHNNVDKINNSYSVVSNINMKPIDSVNDTMAMPPHQEQQQQDQRQLQQRQQQQGQLQHHQEQSYSLPSSTDAVTADATENNATNYITTKHTTATPPTCSNMSNDTNRMNATTNNNSSMMKRKYFTIVAPDDVLLGRGAKFTNNEGNKRFRQLIADHKEEYAASNRHQVKNAIAKEIVHEIIHNRKGLFLRMVENVDEIKRKGYIPADTTCAWVVAEDPVILQKVKQALREVDDSETQTPPPASRPMTQKVSSNALSTTATNKPKRKWIARNELPPKIMTVKPNDVLLGRGAAIIHNEGNIRFRQLILSRKEEYILTKRHQIKNLIAKEIIDEIIKNRSGRFLRIVESHHDTLPELLEGKEYVPIDKTSAWVVADDTVVLEKVKQALRELDDTPVAVAKKRRWNCKLSLQRAAAKQEHQRKKLALAAIRHTAAAAQQQQHKSPTKQPKLEKSKV